MKQLKYKLMLVAATVIWGFAFVVMKNLLDYMSVGWLLGIRFTLSGLLMGIVFHKQIRKTFSKKTLKHGFIIGVFVFAAYYFQTFGLGMTTAGKNAFLTALYIVILPFFWWWLAKQKPTKFNIIASVLAVVGGGFVSLQGGADGLALNLGDMITIVSAFFFTFQFIGVKFWCNNDNVLAISAWQFFFAGLISFLIGMVTEPVPTLSNLDMAFCMSLGYVIVFSTVVAIGFQNVGTANCEPAPAALIMSLEGVFGVIFSVMLTGEVLTAQILVGFCLIFIAIIVSEVLPIYMSKGKDDRTLNES